MQYRCSEQSTLCIRSVAVASGVSIAIAVPSPQLVVPHQHPPHELAAAPQPLALYHLHCEEGVAQVVKVQVRHTALPQRCEHGGVHVTEVRRCMVDHVLCALGCHARQQCCHRPPWWGLRSGRRCPGIDGAQRPSRGCSQDSASQARPP